MNESRALAKHPGQCHRNSCHRTEIPPQLISDCSLVGMNACYLSLLALAVSSGRTYLYRSVHAVAEPNQEKGTLMALPLHEPNKCFLYLTMVQRPSTTVVKRWGVLL